MASDAQDALKAAGFDVEQLPETQQKVLGSLSAEEVKTLIAIKERFDAASEVQGFMRSDGYVIY